ncbi:peroxidase domain-containing protein [Cephalotus follicularis]|uniref:peroxidase n=1 Tax=Cephalotus follicularis TaxID=3775 RepID=A0A1Q3BZI5_CEPFO|nr:peroxidase domain-containing protein [Cephalotus follicularis]
MGQGCDASILLDPSFYNIKSEMGSSKNFGIRKRRAIEDIKFILEMECPGKVSCADIIALAAKEAVAFTGGPQIQLPLGRMDSKTCSYQQANAQLPSSTISVNQLLTIFMSKGMDLEESVAILGAHTLGVGHCINIVGRLYDPQPEDQMSFRFKALLRNICPTTIPVSNLTFVPNDITPTIFDNQYFKNVLMGEGLFSLDSSISQDPRTAPIVERFAGDQNYFFNIFSSAFVKLSSTNVLTDLQGEVRRICNQVN